MRTPTDNTATSRSAHSAAPAQQTDGNLGGIWALGPAAAISPRFRSLISPWAYPRLRAIAAVHFAVGIFLAGLGAVIFSRGHSGWAALPLAGAALHFSIGYLDMAVAARRDARSAVPPS